MRNWRNYVVFTAFTQAIWRNVTKELKNHTPIFRYLQLWIGSSMWILNFPKRLRTRNSAKLHLSRKGREIEISCKQPFDSLTAVREHQWIRRLLSICLDLISAEYQSASRKWQISLSFFDTYTFGRIVRSQYPLELFADSFVNFFFK